MRSIIVVIFTFLSCTIFAEDITLNYFPSYSNTAANAQWTIKFNKPIPKKNFVKLIITYGTAKSNKSFDFILAAHGRQRGNLLYLSISAIDRVAPRICIDLVNKFDVIHSKIYSYIAPLGNKSYNIVDLHFQSRIKLEYGKEAILAETSRKDGTNLIRKVLDNDKNNQIPQYFLKIKAVLSNDSDMYFLTKNFDNELKGKNLKQQREWLLAEKERRFKLFTGAKRAWTGDINIILAELRKVEKKIKKQFESSKALPIKNISPSSKSTKELLDERERLMSEIDKAYPLISKGKFSSDKLNEMLRKHYEINSIIKKRLLNAKKGK